jgi:hypothetical protein
MQGVSADGYPESAVEVDGSMNRLTSGTVRYAYVDIYMEHGGSAGQPKTPRDRRRDSKANKKGTDLVQMDGSYGENGRREIMTRSAQSTP